MTRHFSKDLQMNDKYMKKMFNIIRYQRNANQITTKYHRK